MGMMKEFKDFAMRGNIIDLAVAVVIGGAFGAIIKSFVADIVMPLLGIVTGGLDFTKLAYTVGDASITYGNFLQSVITFILIAFAIFLVIKGINAIKKKEEEAPAAPPTPSKEEVLLAEIRDLLKSKS
jgi:large conductance mechanosensitive channel